MKPYRIVLVDDEQPNLDSLERILKSHGAKVFAFTDAREALECVHRERVDLVMTDLRMEPMSGMELLKSIKLTSPYTEVILMTAYGTVALAVEAMKVGAYDFITKPLQKVQVLRTVERSLERRNLLSEKEQLKDELKSHLEKRSQMVGNSTALRQVLEIAESAAQSHASVLIEGESGTGKGLLASYLHQRSQQSKGIFVKISCAAIPENLLEAELFGYEAGAFTGANRSKKGRVELADGGSLFLDEIGLAPLATQAKLLRFVQEGEFERLGSNETLQVRTRVISATNVDLRKAIGTREFREDLYYRLNVISIRMPPLRERAQDIELLTQQFLQRAAEKNAKSIPLIHPEAMDCLQSYHWPGNIRQLQNIVESLVVLNKKGTIERRDLPGDIGGVKRLRSLVLPIGTSLKQAEKLMMDETLKSTNGDKRLAAKLLGVHPRTIYRHLGQSNESTDDSSSI